MLLKPRKIALTLSKSAQRGLIRYLDAITVARSLSQTRSGFKVELLEENTIEEEWQRVKEAKKKKKRNHVSTRALQVKQSIWEEECITTQWNEDNADIL
ncbi:hypothetical protein DPMN_083510 [Dreissena polymorpha]|uniref:Uncharacterized protein n=1 Tax=Dreissena polymorpha TaxID=45954 RepID=A0A9D3Y910_DREPO|nr:hypothetical protein DPMN_083510 [Dreissena polymorpha]